MLGGLDLSGNFERKSSTSNSITETENKVFEETLEVECVPWKETKVRLEVRKVSLLTPYTAKVKRTIGGRTYEYLITDGKIANDNYSESRCLTETNTVRNILLVGWTGSGKSTLANVLSDSKYFVESNKSKPQTKWGKKSDEFEYKENYYSVIDNIGFGDTEVSEREELIRIGEAIKSTYQGLSHVLFVFKKRFSDKEKEAFGKLTALKITNSLITIVRTNFDNYYNEDECENDKKTLKKESSEIEQVLNNCRGLLHINNEDEDSKSESRGIILDHLHNNCADNPFKPQEWGDIASLIENYFKKKAKLVKEIKENVEKTVEIEQQIDDLKTTTADQVKEKIQGEEISEFVQLAQIVQKAK
jgi:GTPase Era involved in 16S rRNA processing